MTMRFLWHSIMTEVDRSAAPLLPADGCRTAEPHWNRRPWTRNTPNTDNELTPVGVADAVLHASPLTEPDARPSHFSLVIKTRWCTIT